MIVFDAGTKPALMRYIEHSEALEAQVEQILAPLHGKPLAIWGAGTYTRHLLASGALARCDLCALVDKNPHYHGGKVTISFPQRRELTVIPPEKLDIGTDVPILIGSWYYQHEIAREIREIYGITNRIVTLFDL